LHATKCEKLHIRAAFRLSRPVLLDRQVAGGDRRALVALDRPRHPQRQPPLRRAAAVPRDCPQHPLRPSAGARRRRHPRAPRLPGKHSPLRGLCDREGARPLAGADRPDALGRPLLRRPRRRAAADRPQGARRRGLRPRHLRTLRRGPPRPRRPPGPWPRLGGRRQRHPAGCRRVRLERQPSRPPRWWPGATFAGLESSDGRRFGMATAAELQARETVFIGGEWVEPSGADPIEVVNPTTEEAIATVPGCTPVEVDRAVEAAREAFESWSQTPRQERARLIGAIAANLEARADELAAMIAQELG